MSSRQLRKLRGNRVFDLANEILAQSSESDESEAEETFEEYEKRMLAQKQLAEGSVADNGPGNMRTQEEDLALFQMEIDRMELLSSKPKRKKKPTAAEMIESLPEDPSEMGSAKRRPKKKSKKKRVHLDSVLADYRKQTREQSVDSCSQASASPLSSSKSSKAKTTKLQSAKSGMSDLSANLRQFIATDSLIDASVVSRLLGCEPSVLDWHSAEEKAELRRSAESSRLKAAAFIQFPNENGHWPLPYLRYAAADGNMDSKVHWTATGSGVHYLSLQWDARYALREAEFAERRRANGTNLLSTLWLTRAPYHVCTLLFHADHINAASDGGYKHELVQRALYRLELALSRRVHLRTANCRIAFDSAANRSLFRALLKHMHCVEAVASGSALSACLQLCKATLALNPCEDPTYMLLSLDFWALSNGRYDYVLQFASGFPLVAAGDAHSGVRRSVRSLPNWLYSTAIAAFMILSPKQSAELRVDESQLRFDFRLSDEWQMAADLQQCSAAMVSAILIVPSLAFHCIGRLVALLSASQLRRWHALVLDELFTGRSLLPNVEKLCAAVSQRQYKFFRGVLEMEDGGYALMDWFLDCCRVAVGLAQSGQLHRARLVLVRSSLLGAVQRSGHFRQFDAVQWMGGQSLADLVDGAMLQDAAQMNASRLQKAVQRVVNAGRQLPAHLQKPVADGSRLQTMTFLGALFYSFAPWINPIFIDT